MSDLYLLAQSARDGNKDAKEKIIWRFIPLIKKYSRKLNYDGAESDLIIALLEIINNFPFYKKSNNEKEFIAYITVSIKNEYIKLSKKYCKILNFEVELKEDIYKDPLMDIDPENMVLLNMLLEELPENQQKILKELFINGFSENDLAEKLRVTHQAVNKTKRKAINNLKRLIG
ncbi:MULTISPECIES: sigma-70 family RNA polymerase sigma factor [unclassified Dehalobacter]|uniref:sigma-70 family RNA polymerase sigma factor n=1 Tax=unclassified Dehalobacter TaxID=2635733 RepID=UPI00028B9E05|nr:MULTISPECIES: sigma-70 family RNA polymerase sigma factor [unclassified Dehalobacter]AFV01530.1 RNA polymerase sigma factor, sigma-70 family [Dehalobacter sp. DCA]AFV04565.1 RNA polymerase sigma factor, sigma-70 family [Dehalobacter sp. CF]